MIITENDCGTLKGLDVFALKDNDDVLETLSERISGRISLHDVLHPDNDTLLVEANTMISDDVARLIDKSGIETVEVRSALTCQTRRGICKMCYGKSLSTNRMAQVGESVGVVAAQSVGEPGTQLTLRTFHVGGTASRSEVDSSIIIKKDGRLEIDDLRTVPSKDKDGSTVDIVVSRSAESKVFDDNNDVISSSIVPYGSTIFIKKGKVKKGDRICEWDPYNAVIIAEISGKIEFNDIIEGVSYRTESDEQTGYQEKVIIDSRNKKISPSLTIGEKNYLLPVGAHLAVESGDKVIAGDILVKIPRSAGSSGDITGGLPRVTEMFEARNPSNPAVVSEVDGSVSFGKIIRGNRQVIITTKTGEVKKYLIKLSKHILVQENDYVKAGMPLCDGVITPADILAIKGVVEVQQYIVNEIQDVYRLQGVKINDKHFEVLVRQMMRKVKVAHSGDTYFLEGSLIGKDTFQEQNDKLFGMQIVTESGDSEELKAGRIISARELREENARLKRKDAKLVEARDAVAAVATPILQGITRASLQVDSWISAASFQQTTKVLNEAAINAKYDNLIGLKENVIIGKKIPAGTGLLQEANTVVGSQIEYETLMKLKEDSENLPATEEVVEAVDDSQEK